MKSDTQAITINVDQKKLFEFIADPVNLPKWATSLCKSVRADGDVWIMETEMGEVTLNLVTDAKLGVVDFHISPPLPIKIIVNSRILPNGNTSEYIFTQFQIPFMPDSTFEKQKQKVAEQLGLLKTYLESI